MNPLPGKCPVCNNTLTVTRLQCGNCGTGIDGAFGLGRLQALTPDQLQFVETFIKVRGKIKDMESELGISYPTVVARLNEIVRTMGYEVDESELSDVDRYEYYEAQVLNPQPGPGRLPGAPQVAPPKVPAPPGLPGGPRLTPEKRQQIIDDLAAGKITASEAMEKLNG